MYHNARPRPLARIRLIAPGHRFGHPRLPDAPTCSCLSTGLESVASHYVTWRPRPLQGSQRHATFAQGREPLEGQQAMLRCRQWATWGPVVRRASLKLALKRAIAVAMARMGAATAHAGSRRPADRCPPGSGAQDRSLWHRVLPSGSFAWTLDPPRLRSQGRSMGEGPIGAQRAAAARHLKLGIRTTRMPRL